MEKSPIFVLGVRRSGTTLLCLMLNSHSKIHITYESAFLPNYYRDLDAWGNLNQTKNIRAVLSDFCAQPRNWEAEDYPDIERVMDRIGSDKIDLNTIFGAFYQQIASDNGKSRWGDKTPDFALYVEPLSAMFPNAKFVHIVRDCRDVILSRQKIKWYKHDIRTISNEWLESVQKAEQAGGIIGEDRYFRVKYEDLIAEPESTLKELCKFIDEAYEPTMLDFYKAKKNIVPKAEEDRHENTSRKVIADHKKLWKKVMNPADIEIIQNITGKELDRLGYELIDSKNKNTNYRKMYYNWINILDKRKQV